MTPAATDWATIDVILAVWFGLTALSAAYDEFMRG